MGLVLTLSADTPEGLYHEDRIITRTIDGYEVVVVSNFVEDTPEGLFLMDRLRDQEREAENQLREIGGEPAIELKRQFERELERAILYGTGDEPHTQGTLDAMKVYVVELGLYAERYIGGVYSSVEAAIQANPVPNLAPEHPHRLGRREPGWEQSERGTWTNGLDWQSHAEIVEYDLAGPAVMSVAEHDRILKDNATKAMQG